MLQLEIGIHGVGHRLYLGCDAMLVQLLADTVADAFDRAGVVLETR